MPAIVTVPENLKREVGETIINLGLAYDTVMTMSPSVNGETTFITSLYKKSPILKQRFYNLGKSLEVKGGKFYLIDEKTPYIRDLMLHKISIKG